MDPGGHTNAEIDAFFEMDVAFLRSGHTHRNLDSDQYNQYNLEIPFKVARC